MLTRRPDPVPDSESESQVTSPARTQSTPLAPTRLRGKHVPTRRARASICRIFRKVDACTAAASGRKLPLNFCRCGGSSIYERTPDHFCFPTLSHGANDCARCGCVGFAVARSIARIVTAHEKRAASSCRTTPISCNKERLLSRTSSCTSEQSQHGSHIFFHLPKDLRHGRP